jgi:hypothetical protein
LAPRKTVEYRKSATPGEFYLDVSDVHKLDTQEVIAVDLATVAALPDVTQAGAGAAATLTADAVGILTVDGVDAVVNDRILVKDQADASQNGVYVLTTAGEAAVAAILTRATDHDADADVLSGDWTTILGGDTLAGLGAVITTTGTITVDTTDTVWDLFDWTDIEVSFHADVGDGAGF